jgi:ATP-dependent Clp protease ATP-binding subunit ClpX
MSPGTLDVDEPHRAFFAMDSMQESDSFSSNREFLRFVEGLPQLTPREIFDTLETQGYIAQEGPRRALSLMAYRHVQRIRHLHLRGIPVRELPPKSNHLLIGPTGCGKTFLIEQLFRHVFQLPTVLVDITTYSETGYVGQDVSSILTRLLYAADGDVHRAQVGVICLDEFDKIASGQNNAVFAGAGTTKDISGLGVQRELLKLLESASITVPTEFSHSSYQQHILMSTANIPFLACGAFSGFKLVSHLFNKEPSIGFHSPLSGKTPQDIAVSYSQDEVNQTRSFQQYGFLPELIARFDRIIPFRALDEDALADILRRNLVKTYAREFELEGIELVVDDSVVKHLIRQAVKRETGARGLRSAFARLLENASFDLFSEKELKSVHILSEKDEIKIEKA